MKVNLIVDVEAFKKKIKVREVSPRTKLKRFSFRNRRIIKHSVQLELHKEA